LTIFHFDYYNNLNYFVVIIMAAFEPTFSKRFKPITDSSEYSSLLHSHPNLGSRIHLFTNHFRLIVPKCILYHYDVDIRNRSDRRDKRQAEAADRKFRKMWHQINFDLLQRFVQQNSATADDLFFNPSGSGPICPAFDGVRNLYSSRILQKLGTDRNRRFEREITIDFNGKPTRFMIAIKFVTELNLEQFDDFFSGRVRELPNDLIRALDIILRFRPVASGLPVGNSIYPKQSTALQINPNLQIGGAKNVLFGHYQSVRLMSRQLNLIIDRSTAVLYDFGEARDFIVKLLQSRPDAIAEPSLSRFSLPQLAPARSFSNLPDLIQLIDFSSPSRFHDVQRYIELLNNELRAVQIDATHLPYQRRYKIFELTNKCASDLFFDFNPQPQRPERSQRFKGSERRDMTGTRRLNVVTYFSEKYRIPINGNLPCFNVGNRRRPVYLPLEVCRIAPNQVAKKLNSDESGQLIRLASNQPVQARFELIQQSVQNVKRESEQILNEFNMDLDIKPIEVDGIRLNSPIISYSNLSKFSPVYGMLFCF
jgi:eukaryotic translation initiation factor 2C